MHARSQWMMIAAAMAMLLSGMVHAAETAYPTRPVRIIVPYPPGGTTDPTARAFGNWFADKFGTTMVIDNRPGAGSTLGHGLAAKATPDGYTLVLGTSGGLVVSAAFGTKLSYDPVKDFTPIGIGVYVPFLIVVHPSVPSKNVKELIDLAKEMRDAPKRGDALGLTDDELAFYDALVDHGNVKELMSDTALAAIAHDLVETIRSSVVIDWTQKEAVRANMRLRVKRLLRKHGYPPDKREEAVVTVIEQAEAVCRDWAEAA